MFWIVWGALRLLRQVRAFGNKAVFASSVFYSYQLSVGAGIRVETSTSSVTINRFPLMEAIVGLISYIYKYFTVRIFGL